MWELALTFQPDASRDWRSENFTQAAHDPDKSKPARSPGPSPSPGLHRQPDSEEVLHPVNSPLSHQVRISVPVLPASWASSLIKFANMQDTFGELLVLCRQTAQLWENTAPAGSQKSGSAPHCT